MATEIMEYRPGKWVRVVDGQIVGRASVEEVAAWRARQGARQTPAPSPALDVDLDVALGMPPAGPGRLASPPLRPAYERRGQHPEPSPGAPPPQARGDELDVDLTVEMAVARETIARRREARSLPPAERQPAVELVRRRLPAVEVAAPPSVEVTPLPKTPIAPKPTSAKRRSPVERPAARAAEEAPTPESAAEALSPAEETHAATAQGPNYWWIYNANRQPAEAFLREWLPRYQTKFGHAAETVLCHENDLPATQTLGLDVEVSPLLQPGHFYLGHKDGERKAPRGKRTAS